MKILIADDDAVSRLKLTARLVKWGYEVVAVRDGLEAWEVLQQPDAPALAILDWMMPGLDGPELCRRVRAAAREPYLYLVLLTGRGRREDLIFGLEAGADDYVTKPVDAQELEVRVRGGRRIVELQAELLASRQAMWFQATHDVLTGAWNRAAALDALRRELSRARRDAGPCSVMMVDLDHFKHVNDTHGHPAGDAVLREVVRRLGRALRPYDLLARYGGEEFIVVLPGCPAPGAAVVAERLRAVVASTPVDLGAAQLAVTCSVGLATMTEGATAEVLVKRADDALYAAKRAGRNRAEVWAEPPVITALAS
jgi:diguanylate cyclase (GGDEF)-like protein